MLHWISGITHFDHIRSDDIQQWYSTALIANKLREAQLQWYSHILCANSDTLAQKGLQLEVGGK